MIDGVKSAVILALGAWLGGCAAPHPPRTTNGTSVADFANSLGFQIEKNADPDLVTDVVKCVPYHTTLVDRFTGVSSDQHAAREAARAMKEFGNWCEANGGVMARDGSLERSFGVAAREYFQQRLEKRHEARSGYDATGVACVRSGRNEEAVGGYVNLGDADMAFYDPAQVAAFIGRFEGGAKARAVKEEGERTDRLASAAQARAEEETTIAASRAGGLGMEESLRLMARARQDDLTAILASVDHKAPCILIIGDREFRLKHTRALVRDKEVMTIVNPLTQEMGTRVTHILDVSDGLSEGAIEFSSARNAELNAQGIGHLAQLCGETH